ncbi:glycosyltransferase [Cellulomonas sp. JZ18]|uniref:glycosyltransferase n=1 Tax=Cellulomonas sp. JZ18 TaxID=2654191 RepID=UPI0018AF9CDB|nr:glycosyltransferase family 2 protein [Cellulomonas sp. JZ18]
MAGADRPADRARLVTPGWPAAPPTDAAPLHGLAVVVVSYGSSHLLDAGLPATLTAAGAHVVVVDNDSGDAERRAATALCAARGWLLVPSANDGFGAGCNRGVAAARAAGCDVVLLLNPDAAVTSEDARTLLEHVRRHPGDVVSPVVVLPTGRESFVGAVVDVPAGRTRRPRPGDAATLRPWLSGACLALHVDTYTALGGFDERYFMYWEDVDLSWRAVGRGARLVVRDDVRVVHEVGGTEGGVGKSPLYCYWNCRNRMLFAALHLAPADRRRWALRSGAYALEVVLRSGRRVAVRSPRAALAAVRGTVAGLLLARRSAPDDRAGHGGGDGDRGAGGGAGPGGGRRA